MWVGRFGVGSVGEGCMCMMWMQVDMFHSCYLFYSCYCILNFVQRGGFFLERALYKCCLIIHHVQLLGLLKRYQISVCFVSMYYTIFLPLITPILNDRILHLYDKSHKISYSSNFSLIIPFIIYYHTNEHGPTYIPN